MVGEEPLSQLPSISNSITRKLKAQGCDNLRQLTLNVSNGKSNGLPGGLVSFVKALPVISIENISLKFDTKGSKSHGIVSFDVALDAAINRKKGNDHTKNTNAFTVALGTNQHNLLLAQKNIVLSLSKTHKALRRAVSLKFDWNLANAHGGVDSGNVILRVMNTGIRGLDVQYRIKLR
jgi:hypothetical protein